VFSSCIELPEETEKKGLIYNLMSGLIKRVEERKMSESKYRVQVFISSKPKKVPKGVTEELKGALSKKMIARMKKESVSCPVVKKEVAFLVCFSCPSFLRRVKGIVDCLGDNPPPSEWID
jgi:tryptophanyl-tRNA synthetase